MNMRNRSAAILSALCLASPIAYVLASTDTVVEPVTVDVSGARAGLDSTQAAAGSMESGMSQYLKVDTDTDGSSPLILGGYKDSTGSMGTPSSASVTDPCKINPNLASCRADLQCKDMGGTWSNGQCSLPSSGGIMGWPAGARMSRIVYLKNGKVEESVSYSVSSDGNYVTYKHYIGRFGNVQQTTKTFDVRGVSSIPGVCFMLAGDNMVCRGVVVTPTGISGDAGREIYNSSGYLDTTYYFRHVPWTK